MPTAREFLLLVKESALGTVMTSPVAGTDSILIRLTDGNSFDLNQDNEYEHIMYGGGLAITAESVTDHYSCKGNLKTKLYPSQAAFLTNWGLQRINSGQTTPWVTTEVPGDLVSVSCFHAVQQSNGTFLRERFSGTKVANFNLDVSRDSTTATLSMDLVACRKYPSASDGSVAPTLLEFPDPAETDYPYGPFTFSSTGGLLTIGTTRTQYNSLSLKAANKLDGQWFETKYLSLNQFHGRETTLDVDLYFKVAPADRTSYEANTTQAASIGFASSVAGQSMLINMNAQNTITGLKRDLPLDRAFMQKLTLMNRFDPAAVAALTVSFS